MNRPPDYFRRCEDGAILPPSIAALLLEVWAAVATLEVAGERYAPCWRMVL